MTALYLILIDETKQTYQQFNDSKDLYDYLVQCGQRSGEIYLGSLEGFKISYDVQTGIVRLNIINDKPSITHFFQAEAIYMHLEPVAAAVRYITKMKFLEQLQSLDPTIISLKQLINPATGQMLTNIPEERIDALLKIFYEAVTPLDKRKKKLLNWFIDNKSKKERLPIHDDIYNALKDYEKKQTIYQISSMIDVNKVIGEIKKNKMKLVK